jgi:methionine-rich copper-binding protein CopC
MLQSPTTRRRFFLLAASASAFTGPFLSAPRAEAHAIIVSSKPAANSKVAHGNLDILLQFNSRIQIDLSRLDLVDPAGKVSVLAITDGAADGSLTARATAEAAGQWKLRWQVLSTDGHITRGEIPFLVVAP